MMNWRQYRQTMDAFISKTAMPCGFYGQPLHEALLGEPSGFDAVCWHIDKDAVYKKLVDDFHIKTMSIIKYESSTGYKFATSGSSWYLLNLQHVPPEFYFRDFVTDLTTPIGYNGVLYAAPDYFNYCRPEPKVSPVRLLYRGHYAQ